MKSREISDIALAAIVAGATLIGGIFSSTVDTLIIDAGTRQQTNVQLVQLAIGILSAPLDPNQSRISDYYQGVYYGAGVPEDESRTYTQSEVLRAWAVDTINEVAKVKFDADARQLLVRGHINFPALLQHVENPAQTPFKLPLSGLGFGNMMELAPTLGEAIERNAIDRPDLN